MNDREDLINELQRMWPLHGKTNKEIKETVDVVLKKALEETSREQLVAVLKSKL